MRVTEEMNKGFYTNLYYDTVKDVLRKGLYSDDRAVFVKQFSWAVPCIEAIEEVATYCQNGVVEIAAGSGYWARCLESVGVDVVAFDAEPWENLWFPVKKGDHTVVSDYCNRVLFTCWPPYRDPMSSSMLDLYLIGGGETVIYVGEGNNGCTGDELFHEMLKKHFNFIRYIWHPSWSGIGDTIHVYKRRE